MLQPGLEMQLKRLAQIAAVLVALGALAVLAGWLLDNPILKSVVPGFVAMNPMSALLFLLWAAVLSCLSRSSPSPKTDRLVRAAAAAIVLSAASSAAGYLTGWEIGLDCVLFGWFTGENRVAPNTAVNFLCIGASVLILDLGRYGRWGSQVLLLIVLAGTAMSLVGYGYGAQSLFRVGSYIPMSLPSASLFAFAALGALAAQREMEVVRTLLSPSIGGMMARRLLPVGIAIPIVLGLFRVAGQRWGYYDTEFGTAMMTVATVVLLVAAVLVTAAMLNRSDEKRRRAEASLQLYADIVRQLPIGLMVWRLEDSQDVRSLRFVDANSTASELLGVEASSLIGQTLPQAFPAILESDLTIYADVARTGESREIPERLYGDGRVTPRTWCIKAFPLPDCSVGLGFEDISQRKAAEALIKKLNQELEQRDQERTAALAAANRDLVEKNQENEMFVYSVSHDLRSPLVSLQGFSKELGVVGTELRALVDNDAIPAQSRQRSLALIDGDMKQSLRFIQTAALRLSGIIDALLGLSRVGRVEYRPQFLETDALVARVVESLSGELFARNVEVKVASLPPCQADPTAVEQLFANLIGNAVKYSAADRSPIIEVGALRPTTSGSVNPTYFVKDNGLGIPAEYLEKIFQAFKRVHTKVASGEGMGLAIVRRIVERHGGRVWVESAEGQGSTFFFTLPSGLASAGLSNVFQRQGDNRHEHRTDGHLVG